MSLDEFWKSTPWQFAAAVRGWNKSQGGSESLPAPTDAEYDAMIAEVGD
jgi:hypothetical protein